MSIYNFVSLAFPVKIPGNFYIHPSSNHFLTDKKLHKLRNLAFAEIFFSNFDNISLFHGILVSSNHFFQQKNR